MSKRSSASILMDAAVPPLEKTEETALYRQPMSDGQWQNHLTLLKERMESLAQGMLQEAAEGIRVAYDWLEPLMERYCERTCPTCSDICCQASRVFFNLTDLLAMLAMGLEPASGQTRQRPSEPCRYLTSAGCALQRSIRPYVCVWYLCEAQMRLYGEEPASVQRRVVAALEALRRHRLRLESLYESRFPFQLC